MKLEFLVLIYSMINNLIISVAKMVGGYFLNLGSLFADGLHTFTDFVTDIICMVGSKVSKHRPTKAHPFGFGRVEYLVNLFIGVVLFLLGIFIILLGFFKEKGEVPPIGLMWLLVGAIVLKLIAIVIMHVVGEKIHSQVLITSVEESKTDLVSSVIVAIITVLLQFSSKYPFLLHADMIGSVLIGCFVLKTAFMVISENSLRLLGEVEEDKEQINKIEEYLKEFNGIKNHEITLIKYGAYYQLHLFIELDSKLSLRRVTNLERKLKTSILRHRSLNVKYVSIYVTNDLDKD